MSGVLDQLSQSDWASTRLDVSSFRENAYSMTATEKAGTPVDGVALGRSSRFCGTVSVSTLAML